MSLIPNPKPRPKIGPIKGEINIAPIITGIELTFRPTEAIIIAIAKIQALGPLKLTLLRIERSAASVSICASMFTTPFIRLASLLRIVILK